MPNLLSLNQERDTPLGHSLPLSSRSVSFRSFLDISIDEQCARQLQTRTKDMSGVLFCKLIEESLSKKKSQDSCACSEASGRVQQHCSCQPLVLGRKWSCGGLKPLLISRLDVPGRFRLWPSQCHLMAMMLELQHGLCS